MTSLSSQGNKRNNDEDKEKQIYDQSKLDLSISGRANRQDFGRQFAVTEKQNHSLVQKMDFCPEIKIEEQIKIEEEDGIQRQNVTQNKCFVSKEITIPQTHIGPETIPKQGISNEQILSHPTRAELSDKEIKSAIWMNRFQNSLKDQFSLEFFSSIALILNSHTTQSSKDNISIEDIMRFSAFLLSTGISKKSAISDYFEFSLGSPQLISKQLFERIQSILSKDTTPLTFSSVFQKPYEQQQANSSESKLIRTNYLGLFEEFNIFFGQKSSYRRNNNKRLRVLQPPQDIPLKKQDTERSGVQDQSQASIKPKGLELLSNEVHPFSYQTQLFQTDYIYCYNPKTLALCGVKEESVKAEEEEITRKIQPTKDSNRNIFSSLQSGSESDLNLFYSPGKRTASGLFFENYFNLLDSQNEETFQRLQIVCQCRPLRTVDLQEFESNGLRSFAESIYTICINIFSHNSEYTGKTIPFKNILNKIIENLMERANQITLNNKFSNSAIPQNFSPLPSRVISIATQHHTFIKTKHCNFCIVCQKNGTFTKSKYSCSICLQRFGRSIALCLHDCDRLFHQNPYAYMKINDKTRHSADVTSVKKKDAIINKIQDISVSEYIEQLESYQKSISLLMKQFNARKSIALEPVWLKPLVSKNKKTNKVAQMRRDTILESAENQPFINLKLQEVESIILQFPPYVETASESIYWTVDSLTKRPRKKIKLNDSKNNGEKKQSEESDKDDKNSSDPDEDNTDGFEEERFEEQEQEKSSGNEEEEEIQLNDKDIEDNQYDKINKDPVSNH